jgi:hypothetical protein
LRGLGDGQSLDLAPGSVARRSPSGAVDSAIRSGGALPSCPAELERIALISLSFVPERAQPGSPGCAPLQAWPSSIARLDLPVIAVTTEASLIVVSSSVFWMRLTHRARSAAKLLR